jgi:hypothetical protein
MIEIGKKVKYTQFIPHGKSKKIVYKGIIIDIKNGLYIIKLENGKTAIGCDVDVKEELK